MNNQKHKDYLNRILSEIDDLSDKVNRLNKFMKTDKYNSLSYANQHLLGWQLEVMNQYQQILTVRYELNNNKKGK